MSYTDGSEIKMQENTTLTIGNMPAGSDSAPVTLIAGVVNTKFTKLSKSSDARRSVYTPTTVAAVRGTEFRVAVSDGADTRVELTEGKLDVHNPYGGQNIEAGQTLDTGVAQAPAAADASVSTDQWKADQDAKLIADPAAKNAQFSRYVNDFSSRSVKTSASIDDLNKNISGTKEAKAIESSGKELDKMSSSVEEDMYLGAAANDSISAITDRFKNDKKEMYDAFLKLKEESNKVKEQQQRNYEAIQAVKAAYKKARDEIINKQKEEKEKIKQGTDLQKVKPKIEKKGTAPAN